MLLPLLVRQLARPGLPGLARLPQSHSCSPELEHDQPSGHGRIVTALSALDPVGDRAAEQTAGDHAQDDPEDVDQAILATQDHIPQPVGRSVGLAMSGRGGGPFGRSRRRGKG